MASDPKMARALALFKSWWDSSIVMNYIFMVNKI
jgi:hypothetical protein